MQNILLAAQQTLLAQSGIAGEVGHWGVIAIVVAGIIGIIIIGLRQAKVDIPPFIVQILWIIFTVFACVLGINFLLRIM